MEDDANLMAFGYHKSPGRSKSNDTARLSFSMNDEAMMLSDERENDTDLSPPSKKNRAQMPVVMAIKTKPVGASIGPMQGKRLKNTHPY